MVLCIGLLIIGFTSTLHASNPVVHPYYTGLGEESRNLLDFISSNIPELTKLCWRDGGNINHCNAVLGHLATDYSPGVEKPVEWYLKESLLKEKKNNDQISILTLDEISEMRAVSKKVYPTYKAWKEKQS